MKNQMNLPPGLGGFHEELEKESIPKPIQKRLKTKDGRRTFEYHARRRGRFCPHTSIRYSIRDFDWEEGEGEFETCVT